MRQRLPLVLCQNVFVCLCSTGFASVLLKPIGFKSTGRASGTRSQSAGTRTFRYETALVLLVASWSLPSRTSLALDQKTVNDRSKQIQMLSKIDRDRLDRNIQAFQSLSSDQQAKYRSFYADLADDRAHAGGLSALLQTYALWVQTLSPAQRDELQQATDAAQKLAIVRRFKEEHEHSKSPHEPHAEEPLPNPNAKSHFPPKVALDSKDLAAVIKVLVENLPNGKMKPDFEQPQLNMYLPIINASAQLSPSFHEWPEEGLLVRMTTAVRNKDSAAMIGVKSNSKREMMIRLMLMGIMKQAVESVRFPTEEERIQTHEALSPAERQQILTHRREEVERLITKRYFELKGDDGYLKIPNYHRQVVEMFDKLDVQPPPRFTRPKLRQSPGKG